MSGPRTGRRTYARPRPTRGSSRRYLDAVIETAGFNDDARALASIPARHDVWRRVACDWPAERLFSGVLDEEDAPAMARDFAYGLAKRAYDLEDPSETT